MASFHYPLTPPSSTKITVTTADSPIRSIDRVEHKKDQIKRQLCDIVDDVFHFLLHDRSASHQQSPLAQKSTATTTTTTTATSVDSLPHCDENLWTTFESLQSPLSDSNRGFPSGSNSNLFSQIESLILPHVDAQLSNGAIPSDPLLTLTANQVLVDNFNSTYEGTDINAQPIDYQTLPANNPIENNPNDLLASILQQCSGTEQCVCFNCLYDSLKVDDLLDLSNNNDDDDIVLLDEIDTTTLLEDDSSISLNTGQESPKKEEDDDTNGDEIEFDHNHKLDRLMEVHNGVLPLELRLRFKCWINPCVAGRNWWSMPSASSDEQQQRLYDSQAELDEHLLQAHETLPPEESAIKRSYKPRHACLYCPRQACSQASLYQHIYFYHQKGDYHCTEADCDFVAHYRGDLKRHNYADHRTNSRHTCIMDNGQCKRQFAQLTDLKLHQLQEHSTGNSAKQQKDKNSSAPVQKMKPLYRCTWPSCGYSSKQKGRLSGHIVNKHGANVADYLAVD